MGKIFYISDLHFGHDNIIKLDNRPFNSVEEMNETIISNWNSVVDKNDTVMILGDFCWGFEDDWIFILDQLHSNKVLVRGNHDLRSMSKVLRSKFLDVKDYKEIKDDGRRVLMSHYPMPFYRSAYNPDIVHLFGHVHKTIEHDFMEHMREYIDKNDNRERGRHIGQFYNVGCMLPYMNYIPRTLNEIIAAHGK